MIAEYTFDTISGTAVTDTSGNGKHGTAYNAVTYAQGVVSNCAHSDGVSARVDLANDLWLRNDASISFFYKLDSPSTNITQVIIDFCGTAFKANNLASLSVVAWKDLNAVSLHNGASVSKIDLPIRDSEWHFIANCRCGDNAFYQYDNTSGQHVAAVHAGETRATRHTLFSDVELSGARNAKAELDQVRLFGRKLESYEISSLYNGGAGC